MNKRVVSLDVGMKFVGLAVTDPTWNFPVVVGTLKRRDSIKDDLKRLDEMVQNFDLVAFVIGFPLKIGGEEGSFAPVVKGFERRLKEIYRDSLFFRVDEFHSSREAASIKNANKKNYRKIKQLGKIDSTAAAIILERFMESQDFKKLKSKFCN